MSLVRRVGLAVFLALPAAVGADQGQLSLSLDALGDLVLAPSNSPSPAGLGLSAGFHYRLPDVPSLALGLGLGFNEFPGGTGFQADWLDLDAKWFPLPASPEGEWYLEGGVGPQFLSSILPNEWNGGLHAGLGVGRLFSLGGGQAFDLGLQYDWFSPTGGPLEDLALKAGFTWSLDQEADQQPKPHARLFTQPKPSPTPTPRAQEAAAAPVSTPAETPEPASSPTPAPETAPTAAAEDGSIPARLTSDIFFGWNRDVVTPKAARRAAELGGLLAGNSDRVVLTGYADDRGTAGHNLELSRRRAEAVRAILVAQGVREGRVTAQGKGSEDPAASNDDAGGRAENRRVEIQVLAPAGAP